MATPAELRAYVDRDWGLSARVHAAADAPLALRDGARLLALGDALREHVQSCARTRPDREADLEAHRHLVDALTRAFRARRR